MADRRDILEICGALQFGFPPYDNYPTDADWSYERWRSRVANLVTYKNGVQKGFLSWEWWESKRPAWNLGYKDLSRSDFNALFSAARSMAVESYTRGITLPEDTPTDYQLTAYVIIAQTENGVYYRLCRKPKPAASEYTGKKDSRKPVTNNEETFYTATDSGLQMNSGAFIPYSEIVAVTPVSFAVKTINEGKAPLYEL